ncbi:YlaI family protein [Halalkalibacillus halophilus]|uniref:YlaI family protein n=1 Tax=Halalkalibacillus halophilus TaxID=392827 RepID=UPI0004891743|nr:DUF2197 domain-containing protein [Halalkalibacillus halophilus]
MRAQCILCDEINKLDPFSLLAKQLRKKRKLTYICDNCNDRISKKTYERRQNDNFKLYREEVEDDLLN